MSKDIQIRSVTVELLRAGPAHNQLLSPLTQYLGICDDAQAGIVTLPYEQLAFMRRMKSMRYDSGEEADRLPVLHEIGIEMAKVLGAIPRLPGSLTGDNNGADTLIHLRLVLSASELATLPFELAKIPIGPSAWAEGWLSLQARVPVVITRRTRNVSANGVHWPMKPRILFISSDPAQVPFAEHRKALLDAIAPFRYPVRDDPKPPFDGLREQFGELLTILTNPRFDEVAAECAQQIYTHVHILAHGDIDPAVEVTSYGLVLQGADGAAEVVSGERFASAFVCMSDGVIRRPSVVTLASCDGGDVGSVMVAGASIAHALHQAGIPLVLASQFPLSKAGSVLVAQRLYPGLLRGDNPCSLLHTIRTELHSRLTSHAHDWASLVVYEALPPDLSDQLVEARYQQGKRAINAALEHVDQAVAGELGAGPDEVRNDELAKAVLDASNRLPIQGRFAMECLGLRASSRKRLAEAEFSTALRLDDAEAQARHVVRSCGLLEQSLTDYGLAVTGLLVNEGGAAQQVSTLHWVLVQQLCLSAVLGAEVSEGTWETALLSASAYLELNDTQQRAWAHGSLAELWLLKMTQEPLDSATRDKAAANAREHASRLLKLFHDPDAFPIESTRKQFVRYVKWWGQPMLERVLQDSGLAKKRGAWQDSGVVATAEAIVGILERRGSAARAMRNAGPRTPVPLPALPPAAAALALPAPATGPPAAVVELLSARVQVPPGTFFHLDMLPAGHGDSLWIEYGDDATTSRLLVDCGTEGTFATLQRRIGAMPAEARAFELFILSHIDADHIGGAIPLVADKTLGIRFGDIWFNGWKHLPQDHLNARQGEVFTLLVDRNDLPWNRWRDGKAIMVDGDTLPTCTLPSGMQLTLLSPTRDKLAALSLKWAKEIKELGLTAGESKDFERFLGRTVSSSTDVPKLAATVFTPDNAPANGSSIAVLAEYRGKSALLAADAHAPVLVASIGQLLKQRGQSKLHLDAFKLSHHASRNNVSVELMALLDCKNYLVSTDGKHFNHPDREAIARVIQHGGANPTLWFNFTTSLNVVWATPELKQRYGYEAVYPPPGEEGMLFKL